MKRFALACSAIVCSLLTACADVPRQAFNKDMARELRTVAVTDHAKDEEVGVNILAHPGVNFGLIGGLIAAADLSAKSTKVTAALDPKQTRVQHRLSDRLSEELKTGGYVPEIVSFDQPLKADDAFKSATQRTKADAVLTIAVNSSYVAAGPSSDYFPYVVANVKVFDQKTGKVLYEDTISYGYTFQYAKTIHLPCDMKYRFRSVDDIVARAAEARDGLLAGADAIAAQVAMDLKR